METLVLRVHVQEDMMGADASTLALRSAASRSVVSVTDAWSRAHAVVVKDVVVASAQGVQQALREFLAAWWRQGHPDGPVMLVRMGSVAMQQAEFGAWVRAWVATDHAVWCTGVRCDTVVGGTAHAAVWGVCSGMGMVLAQVLLGPGRASSSLALPLLDSPACASALFIDVASTPALVRFFPGSVATHIQPPHSSKADQLFARVKQQAERCGAGVAWLVALLTTLLLVVMAIVFIGVWAGHKHKVRRAAQQ